ncbi:hypothetical protein C4577_01735 [Candidatus Parcubacteria bacterium]|nr:MAG: hypothetical protein C4577_01735 [Candidatus Parcubacteria bacterium]
MAYLIILAGILILSPLIITLASSQNKKVKSKLRIIFLSLLFLQIFSGFFNWEAFLKGTRTGFELALNYPSSFLGIFFIVSLIQVILLAFAKRSADVLAVILNFTNTILLFTGMIRVSNMTEIQAFSFASLVTIFSVLIGNVAGLMFINKDKNLMAKYPWSQNYVSNAKKTKR